MISLVRRLCTQGLRFEFQRNYALVPVDSRACELFSSTMVARLPPPHWDVSSMHASVDWLMINRPSILDLHPVKGMEFHPVGFEIF